MSVNFELVKTPKGAKAGLSAVTKAAKAYQAAIEANAPKGRRRREAITALETSLMFAKRSVISKHVDA